MENLTSSQKQEVGMFSNLLSKEAQTQGEQEVPLIRKRSRPSRPSNSLPPWPAPPSADGFGFMEEESLIDSSPALKRRKFIAKPANPTYLLDDLLTGDKTLELSHSAETLLLKTLAFQANPSLLESQIPKFLTPSNLPKPSAQHSDTPILPLIPAPTAEALPSSTPKPSEPEPEPEPSFTIPPYFTPYLDTDSDCDPEYAPNPPSPPKNKPSSPKPSAHHNSSSMPSSSTNPAAPSTSNPSSSYRGVPSMPIPIRLEDKVDYALEMLQKISRQLQDLHTQQQVGFADLQLRHDTNDINMDAAAGVQETSQVTTSRILLGEVRKIFTRGSPRYQTEEENADWRKKLALEVDDARRVGETAVQGERNMRALNVRLLQEINDLRRQLNQAQYLNVPIDRDVVSEHKAEADINRRIDEAAAREADRHRQQQDRVNNVREAIHIID